MQIIADSLRNFGQIIQAQPSRGSVVVNGRYVVESPTGVEVAVDENSYVHPVDGGDLKSLMMSELLRLSGYSYLYFNPLNGVADHSDLDSSAEVLVGVFPNITRYSQRAQLGLLPNTTKLLKAFEVKTDPVTTETKVGVILTKEIDISLNAVAGVSTLMPYWEAHTFSLSHENEDTNTPVIKTYERLEPSALQVYVTTDGGAFWEEITHLQTYTLSAPSASIQFLFINNSTTTDVYLNAFGFMY